MKTKPASVLCCLALTAVAFLPAAGQWADSPEYSLSRSEDLSFLAISASGESGDRAMRDSVGLVRDFEIRNAYLLVTCEILPWLSVNAGGGQGQLRVNQNHAYSNEEALWTAGARANLWEYEVKSPSFLISRLQIHANLSYWDGEANIPEDTSKIDWNEKRAELIFSAERFVTHPGSDHTVYPYSLLFFLGPVFSDFSIDATAPVSSSDGTTLNSSIDEDEEFGGIAGANLFISYDLSLGYEARIFSGATHKITLAYHF